jgi:hypothetical protein
MNPRDGHGVVSLCWACDRDSNELGVGGSDQAGKWRLLVSSSIAAGNSRSFQTATLMMRKFAAIGFPFLLATGS